MAEAPATLARRLHSVSGVVPVGAFLAFHLYTNAAARRGADAYNATARRLQEIPLLLAVEVLLVAAPLFFHGIYGLFLLANEAPAAGHRSAGRRALATVQRVTGVVLFAFVLLHLWTARLVQVRDHRSLDLFRLMQAVLASPWLNAAYVAGVLAATFHLSAGLWTFAETWGIATTPRARLLAAAASAGVFAAPFGDGPRVPERLPLVGRGFPYNPRSFAMKVHEYQAKSILAHYGVAVPRGEVTDSPAEATEIARRARRPRRRQGADPRRRPRQGRRREAREGPARGARPRQARSSA